MKTILLTLAVVLLSSTSQAVVADRFNCQVEVKDIESGFSAKQKKDFFIARLPLSASPSPDVRLTASQTTETITLDTPKAEMGANLNFYYKHAVRIDGNGTPVEARQMTCIGLSMNYCEKAGGPGNIRDCSKGSIACFESPDPFDPNFGWSPARLVDDVPTFNEQTLAPVSATMMDENRNIIVVANMSCQYTGTFQ